MSPPNIRLLIVAYHFPPMNSAGAQRPHQMLKLLPRFGVDVSVLTHSFERTDLEAEPWVLRVYDSNSRGISKLIHVPLRILQRLSRRLGRSTSWHGVWARGVTRRANEIMSIASPDVVMSTYPPIETLEVGLHLNAAFNVPLVADFRDGLLFEPVEPTMLESASTRARYRRVESKVAKRASAIVTVSEPISEYFRHEYAHPNVVTLPNGFDPSEPFVAPKESELDSKEFNIVYTGRLGISRRGAHASLLWETFTRVVRDSAAIADKLRIHLVGEFSSGERAQLRELIARGTIRLHGFVERPRALGFQRAASLLLLIANSGESSIATTKLFEYLGAQRPILGITRGTAAEKIIRETQSGFVVDPGDPGALYSLLHRLINEPGFVDSVKPRVSEVQKYSRPEQMEQFAARLRALVRAGQSGRQKVSGL